MFENENTHRRFMTERAEGEFHVRYEKALERVRSEFGRKYPMVIGGSEVWTSQTVPQYSPIDTRLLLARLPTGGAQHAKKAVAAAKKSFETWGRSDFRERVKIMRAAADIMSEKKFELAALISYENGKNRYEAIADVDEAIDFVRFYAEEMERNNGYEMPMNSASPNEKSKSVMKPFGVWGVIAPFNFPAAILVGMSTGAMITGNSVVLKPSSNTPIVAFKFVEIMKQAGLPGGVLNLVIGSGSKVGGELVSNKDVSGIVFTGSGKWAVQCQSSSVLPGQSP
jgi:1-pyrroline-5-carboxylate dehydrogenase